MEIHYRFNDYGVVGASVYHPIWGVLHFDLRESKWIPYESPEKKSLHYRCIQEALEAIQEQYHVENDYPTMD